MNSVTGARLAATLARRGGLGVLPQDMPLQELDAAIRWVKAQPVPWDTPLVLPPEATVADASRLLPATEGHGIIVASKAPGDGSPLMIDDVLGIVAAARLGTALADARLGDLARGRTPSIDADDVTSDPARVRSPRRGARRRRLRAPPRRRRRHPEPAQRAALDALLAGGRRVRPARRGGRGRHQRRCRGEGPRARRRGGGRARHRHRARTPGGHAAGAPHGRGARASTSRSPRGTSSPPRACTISSRRAPTS